MIGTPHLIATAAFGLDAVVKREVTALGFECRCVDNRVDFFPENIPRAMADANLWLRCADRVLLCLGQFRATTFDELFEGTRALDWEMWITKNGKFTVNAKSVRSGLYSVPDVQSIVKKAIVERLRSKYNVDWFSETGPEYTVQAALLKDAVTLTIDTTGARNGLHKRGYRARHTQAPMKETMAAALLNLARYIKPGRHGPLPLLDPCCGSGTIPIEAALMARNIAPGLSREFVSQRWPQIKEYKEARSRAYAQISTDAAPEIFAADIDPAAVELAQENAELAGVDDIIQFANKSIGSYDLPADRGIAIINPPYGERLDEPAKAEAIYKQLGRMFRSKPWNVYVLSPDEFFESAYGKTARAKRKLFNGPIKTDYYQYYS